MFRSLATAATASLLAAACSAPPSSARPEPPTPAPLPAPSCEIAVGELTFRLDLLSRTEVRDSLVGECIDAGWTMSERQCVASATDTIGLAECVATTTRIVAHRDSGEAVTGIAGCDRAIAIYRQCIGKAMPVTLASDTQEALEVTIAAWREQIASGDDRGWRDVQRQCSALTEALPRTLRRYGCDRAN